MRPRRFVVGTVVLKSQQNSMELRDNSSDGLGTFGPKGFRQFVPMDFRLCLDTPGTTVTQTLVHCVPGVLSRLKNGLRLFSRVGGLCSPAK